MNPSGRAPTRHDALGCPDRQLRLQPVTDSSLKTNAYLIVHPHYGVYLGSHRGRGYWSKVDSVGQPAAVTFASRQDALDYMASWSVNPPPGIDLIPVQGDGPGYATVAACVRAGAPGWLDALTPTVNDRDRAM
jgi:hypothetical protein